MSKNKKKGYPNGATSEQPKEQKMSGQTNPDSTRILPQTDVKYNGFVASKLPRGKENPIPGRVLVDMLKLKNLRELTQIIELERKRGAPICASVDNRNPGYYLADSAEELEDYLLSLDRRIENVSMTRSYCAKTLQGWLELYHANIC